MCLAGLGLLSAQANEPSGLPKAATFAGWLDAQGTATLETLEQDATWETFTGWKGWAYGPEPVWLRVQVPAATQADQPNFILVVRPPFLDKVGFYDPAQGVQKTAGDFFPAKDDALDSVLFTFDVPAMQAERYVYLVAPEEPPEPA
jgi:hypothetical protein